MSLIIENHIQVERKIGVARRFEPVTPTSVVTHGHLLEATRGKTDSKIVTAECTYLISFICQETIAFLAESFDGCSGSDGIDQLLEDSCKDIFV